MPIGTRRFRQKSRRYVRQLEADAVEQAVTLAREARKRIIVPHDGSGFGGHPIDTGRGIRSWNTSVGTPNPTEPGIDAARPSQGKVGTTVWVASAVPYLHFVEFGTVTITPRRWVRNALAGMGLHGSFSNTGGRDGSF